MVNFLNTELWSVLCSRWSETSRLKEIIKGIDTDVFRALENKEIRDNLSSLRNENDYFPSRYFQALGSAIAESSEVPEFQEQDFKVVTRQHMANLAELTSKSKSEIREIIGNREYKTVKKKNNLEEDFPSSQEFSCILRGNCSQHGNCRSCFRKNILNSNRISFFKLYRRDYKNKRRRD